MLKKRLENLVQAGLKILGRNLLEPGKATDKELVEKYKRQHTEIFFSIYFDDDFKVASVRDRWKSARVAEILRNEYSSPLAGGPGAMCVETQMCTPAKVGQMYAYMQQVQGTNLARKKQGDAAAAPPTTGHPQGGGI